MQRSTHLNKHRIADADGEDGPHRLSKPVIVVTEGERAGELGRDDSHNISLAIITGF